MSLRSRGRMIAPIALCAIGALGLAACSSSSKSPSSGGTTPAASSGASSSSSSGPATGTPLKVMLITSVSNPQLSSPETATAAKAFAATANAAGGINNHPIDVEVCDSSLDPNKETACLQQAVTDDVVAVVGSLIAFGSGLPLLLKAGIPNIGSYGLVPTEYTDTNSFPAAGGAAGWAYGQVASLKSAGITSVGSLVCAEPGCVTQKSLEVDAAKLGNMTLSQVTWPSAGTTFTTEATQMAGDNPGGIITVGPTGKLPVLVRAIKQTGFKGPVVLEDATATPDNIKAMGADAEGALVAGLYAPITDTTNSEVVKFKAAMIAQDPSAQLDALAENTWNGFDLFEQVAKTISGDITKQSLMTALGSVTTPINLGLSGPWISPGHGTPPVAQFPQLGQLNYFPEKVDNGQLVAVSGAVNPIKVLQGS